MLTLTLPFLCENRVLAGQVVGQRQKIIASCLLILALPLNCFSVAFDIFRKEIFSANLVEIAEMIDAFVRVQAYLIEGLADKLLLAPVYVPVILLGLPVVSSQHGFLDAVGEERLEFDIIA